MINKIIALVLIMFTVAIPDPIYSETDNSIHLEKPLEEISLNRNLNKEVMDYPIPQVIARYMKDYNVSEADAKIHEIELKKFFILSHKYPENFGMFSKEVDNLWHTFLLFTKDYQKFCDKMFGKFIHHVPEIENNG